MYAPNLPFTSIPAAPAPTESLSSNYIMLPAPLLADLQDSVVAIGVYCLIARSYFATRQPVPLSANDLLLFDPALSHGSATRALARLQKEHWVSTLAGVGRAKTTYTPTWGLIDGSPRLWDLHAPALGRPRHVRSRHLDRQLLDSYLGKINTHPIHPARIERYLTEPLLGLRDVGTFALALDGQLCSTPTLERWELVRDGVPQTPPTLQRLLALASQQPLHDPQATVALSPQGLQRMGMVPDPVEPKADSGGEPLFFVPPDMIGGMIGGMIGRMIGQPEDSRDRFVATESHIQPPPLSQAVSPGILGILGNLGKPTQPGKGVACEFKIDLTLPQQQSLALVAPLQSIPLQYAQLDQPESAQQEVSVWKEAATLGQSSTSQNGGVPSAADPRRKIANTDTAYTLRDLGVSPHVVAELADLPLEKVAAVIADARRCPAVRNLAAWVVTLLRNARKNGWESVRQSPEAAAEAVRLAGFAAAEAAGLLMSDSNLSEAALAAMLPLDEDAVPYADTPRQPLVVELRAALRVRLPPSCWPLLDRLRIEEPGATLVLRCEPADLQPARALLASLLGPVLRELGWLGQHQILVAAPTGQLPPASVPQVPSWIDPALWDTLPRMLRAALLGASWEGGTLVRGATPAMTALLASRFATEVQALLGRLQVAP